MSINAHQTIYVITPELSNESQLFFRDNLQPMISGKHVLILMASVTTGITISRSMDCVRYYGGQIAGVSAIYSAAEAAEDGTPINALFRVSDLPDYASYSAHNCPMCRRGDKIDALVTGNGYPACKAGCAVWNFRSVHSHGKKAVSNSDFETAFLIKSTVEILDFFGAAGMTQLSNGLVFNLADPFPGDAENLAHFFQRMGSAVVHSEAHPAGRPPPDPSAFPGSRQSASARALEVASAGPGVLSSSTKEPMVVSSSSPTGVSRLRVSAAVRLASMTFSRGRFRSLAISFHGRLPAQLLHQLPVAAGRLVDDLHHMHRHADGAGLIGNGAGDGLPDPPGGICGEFVSLCPIKLVHRAD